MGMGRSASGTSPTTTITLEAVCFGLGSSKAPAPQARTRRLKFANRSPDLSPAVSPTPMRRVTSSPGSLQSLNVTPPRRGARSSSVHADPYALTVDEALQTVRHLVACASLVGAALLVCTNAGALLDLIASNLWCLQTALASNALGSPAMAPPACGAAPQPPAVAPPISRASSSIAGFRLEDNSSGNEHAELAAAGPTSVTTVFAGLLVSMLMCAAVMSRHEKASSASLRHLRT